MGGVLRFFLVAMLLPVGTAVATAQSAAATDVLREMAGHAGVIFAGQVASVTREDAGGFVDIRFRIEQCVRACPRAGAYTLREWAGLWTANPDRYKVGQRRLMLLTARGRSGMSAPVGGMDGAIPLIATAVEPIADQAGVAPADTPSSSPSWGVDLRWVEARALRASVEVGVQSRAVAVGRPMQPIPDPNPVGWEPITALNAPSSATSATLPTLTSVIALLQSATGATDARY